MKNNLKKKNKKKVFYSSVINHIEGTWLLASVLREREGTFILFLFHATVIIVDAPIYGFPFRFINHNRVCSKGVMMKHLNRGNFVIKDISRISGN